MQSKFSQPQFVLEDPNSRVSLSKLDVIFAILWMLTLNSGPEYMTILSPQLYCYENNKKENLKWQTNFGPQLTHR